MTIQQNFSRNSGNSTNNLDPTTGQALSNTNNGNVSRVALDACSSSLNPNQTWFVGN
jgi:pSer/pThr/pTyr-binding forkhead associated (FHA) protein